ncbi:MAG: carboxypeptidase regulatory-like domain-containing protein [Planctomycetaceae bacterium]|nr:carboxypeptidase regulatory-like domain-containing protein [Planctomycetaceae bacterium]
MVQAGCGGGVDPKAPKFEPVTGIVTLDDEPLNSADIVFIPTNGQTESSGRANAEGKYTLSIRNHKGAVAGTYKVTISKRVREDGSEFPEDRSNMGIGKEILPFKYVDRANTELTAQVDAGDNEINFDLKSK